MGNSATHRAPRAVVQPGYGAAAQILFTLDRGGRIILLYRRQHRPVHASGEIEGAVVALARTPGGSLIVMPDAFTAANRDLIIALAAGYARFQHL
jgi:hypothetical protein